MSRKTWLVVMPSRRGAESMMYLLVWHTLHVRTLMQVREPLTPCRTMQQLSHLSSIYPNTWIAVTEMQEVAGKHSQRPDALPLGRGQGC